MKASIGRRVRIGKGGVACVALVAGIVMTGCNAAPAGGGGGTPANAPPAGGGDSGPYTITGRDFSIPLGEGGRFDLSASGVAARTALAVELFTQLPSDAPSAATLSLTASDAQVGGGADQTVTVTTYIGSSSSLDPCGEGENVGSFVLSTSGGAVGVMSGSISLTATAVAYARTGSFTLCLEAVGEADALLSVGALTLVFGTGTVPTPGPEPEPEPDPTTTVLFTQYTNPGDPLLFSASTPDGEQLEYYAEKDEDGYPTKIVAMRYQSPDKVGTDEGTWVHFDDAARPNRFIGDDGTILDLAWTSDTEFVLSGVTGDGAVQINTAIDLNEPADETAKRIAASVARSRLGLPLQLEMIDLSQAGPGMCLESDVIKRNLTASAASSSASVYIQVMRCGAGVDDASVFVLYDNPYGGPFGAAYPAEPTGSSGTYRASLPMPAPAMDGQKAEDICRDAIGKLGTACTMAGPLGAVSGTWLCAKVSAAIDLSIFGPTGEAIPIFAACETGLAAYLAVCAAIGTGPVDAPPGTPGIGDFVCDHIKSVVEFTTQPVSELKELKAYARVPGKGQKESVSHRVSSLGPFPTLTIDFGGDVSIDSFSTNPPDPGPGQGYVAEVLISCATGASVTIAVSGSDNYSNSVTTEVPGELYKATLSVPGGQEGVRDTISVLVIPSLLEGLEAPSVSKTIGVVF